MTMYNCQTCFIFYHNFYLKIITRMKSYENQNIYFWWLQLHSTNFVADTMVNNHWYKFNVWKWTEAHENSSILNKYDLFFSELWHCVALFRVYLPLHAQEKLAIPGQPGLMKTICINWNTTKMWLIIFCWMIPAS
jgi:hypothetical protein